VATNGDPEPADGADVVLVLEHATAMLNITIARILVDGVGPQ
jgi:hypothetical protein